MDTQTSDAEVIETVETSASALPAVEPKKSRFASAMAAVKAAPKLKVGLPVLAVAIMAYGFHTGYLQQMGGKASAAIASLSAKPVAGKDTLTVAREAFAAGDMKAAIEGYRAAIASNPSALEARGELGNVLYNVGATSEAAQAYFETAKLAIDQNHPEVAEALMPAVIEGNPMLADQLSDKLHDAQMRADLSRTADAAPAQQGKQPS
jgi:Flp pilus assembly protein TadD